MTGETTFATIAVTWTPEDHEDGSGKLVTTEWSRTRPAEVDAMVAGNLLCIYLESCGLTLGHAMRHARELVAAAVEIGEREGRP